MAYEAENGWLSVANGIEVRQEPADMGLATWRAGGPFGILFHYTAGCNDDIKGTLESKGFGATFNVGRSGVVFQYASLNVASWHAYDASHFYVGIEHTAFPGTCDLTDEQLDASAKLSAALVEYVRDRWGTDIPLVKIPAPIGIDDFEPGFLDHRDGKSDWNPNVHTDHLYRWTWNEYLAAIAAVEGDLMYEEFKKGVRARRAGETLPVDASSDRVFGWNLEDRIQKALEPTAPAPPSPHVHDLTVATSTGPGKAA